MEQKHGGDIYTYPVRFDFSANINPYGPGEEVIQAMKNSIGQVSHYPDPACRALRKGLMEKEQVPEESILCGNGAAELLYTLVFAQVPKKAVLSVPCFSEYEQALKAVGCEIVYFNLKEENGFALTEEYLDLLKEDIDLIILCSPNNPTGNLFGRELLLEILNCCRKFQIRLVVDECFLEFTGHFEEESMKPYLEAKELVILKAFTKFYSIPGIRLGYLLSSDRAFIGKMQRCRQPWSVSAPAQAGGVAALGQKKLPVLTRKRMKEERTYLMQELNRLSITYFPPEANYILVKSKADLFMLFKEKGFLIRDCSNYRGLCKGFYRFAIRSHEENQLLVKALEEIQRERGV